MRAGRCEATQAVGWKCNARGASGSHSYERQPWHGTVSVHYAYVAAPNTKAKSRTALSTVVNFGMMRTMNVRLIVPEPARGRLGLGSLVEHMCARTLPSAVEGEHTRAGTSYGVICATHTRGQAPRRPIEPCTLQSSLVVPP